MSRASTPTRPPAPPAGPESSVKLSQPARTLPLKLNDPAIRLHDVKRFAVIEHFETRRQPFEIFLQDGSNRGIQHCRAQAFKKTDRRHDAGGTKR